MSLKVIIATICASFLAAVSTWLLIPPFPSPSELQDTPLAALTQKFGHPDDSPPMPQFRNLPVKWFSWRKSRGFAVWTLRVNYREPLDPLSPPDGVSRCLETRLELINVLLPCEMMMRGRVLAVRE
jgi:hypothetical protein